MLLRHHRGTAQHVISGVLLLSQQVRVNSSEDVCVLQATGHAYMT